MMVAITGVSGSGKSTLVHDVLYRSLVAPIRAGDRRRRRSLRRYAGAVPEGRRRRTDRQHRHDRSVAHRAHAALQPGDLHQGVRHNPRPVRLHARGPEARIYSRTLSFNIPGGRCEVCQGDGTVTVEMQFLADVELICEECKGTRYKSGILEIRYNGLNIHEALQLRCAKPWTFSAPRRAWCTS